MSEVILVDQADGIATSLQPAGGAQRHRSEKIGLLRATLARLEHDPAVRVLVLTGAGAISSPRRRHLLRESKDWTPDERRHQFESVVHRIHPVVLTCGAWPSGDRQGQGAAPLGVSLVMACDLAIAADDARFNLGYTLIGASRRARARSSCAHGRSRRRWSWHCCRNGSTPPGARLGIVNRVVPVAELDGATQELALRLAAGPTSPMA